LLETMFDRLKIDPGHRTLGELLQERQWAVQEISRLQNEVARLNARRDGVSKLNRVDENTRPPDPSDPLAGRRLLRLADVKKLVGFGGSTIYRLISEGQFPERIHYGPRAVRWREADIIAWQNSAGKFDEERSTTP
jgi:prophage regulatory protein